MVRKKSGKNFFRNRPAWLWTFLAGILLGGLFFIYALFHYFFETNVAIKGTEYVLYIPTDSKFEDVLKKLADDKILIHPKTFLFVAKQLGYINKIHAGRYMLKGRMSNIELVRMLRSGIQSPVNLVLHTYKTREEFAEFISSKLECPQKDLLRLVRNDNFLSQFGMTPQTVMCLFIPNTYELYWNVSAENFTKRMYDEYKKFWNRDRLSKADKINLTPVEVSVLASIVEGETYHDDEKDTIAGVYLNRLKKNMKLQADPTVIFAMNDYSIRRVLGSMLTVDSPYNTYKYSGLPPGPINNPSPASIDAVLNYARNDYLYFCARGDGSGYHVYAKNIKEHRQNAKKYQTRHD